MKQGTRLLCLLVADSQGGIKHSVKVMRHGIADECNLQVTWCLKICPQSGCMVLLVSPCPARHVMCRDFFIFTAIKAGDSLLEAAGLAHKEHKWLHDAQMFSRWARGETGFPFVDACMRELAATGYMSNRGRQNVASFLTKVEFTA